MQTLRKPKSKQPYVAESEKKAETPRPNGRGVSVCLC